MNEKDKQAMIQRYSENLKKYGYSPKTLEWFKNRQHIRFKALSEIGDLDNSSILDVGCGFGDLYGFLIKKGLSIKYTGYDINENLIEIGREVYPDAHFEIKDIEEDKTNEKFDWVFSCGIFNNKMSDNEFFIQNMLKKMFELCSKGVAADFMSTYVDFKNEGAYYANPEEIFKFCKFLSRRVLLRHDYMPFEFCIYVYKNERINKRNVFIEFTKRFNIAHNIK